eukprot:6186550-Pleurochrysis_carterae.AAC.7
MLLSPTTGWDHRRCRNMNAVYQAARVDALSGWRERHERSRHQLDLPRKTLLRLAYYQRCSDTCPLHLGTALRLGFRYLAVEEGDGVSAQQRTSSHLQPLVAVLMWRTLSSQAEMLESLRRVMPALPAPEEVAIYPWEHSQERRSRMRPRGLSRAPYPHSRTHTRPAQWQHEEGKRGAALVHQRQRGRS